MPHDSELADRIRGVLRGRRGVTERKMFGGICFMVNGHMAAGVANDDLMLRLGKEGAGVALQEPHTRPMDFTGKPMKTMVFVGPRGVQSEGALNAWVGRAVDFARSLPPK